MTANNQKAKELIATSQELLNEADDVLRASDDQACENVSKYVQLREDVLEQSVKNFNATYQKINNCSFQDAELNYSGKELEDIKEHFYNETPKIVPIDIPHIRTAGFSSLLIGLFWSALTFVIFIAVSMFMTGSKIYLDVMPTAEQTQPLFEFYGNIVMSANGTAFHGILFTSVISVLIGLIIALLTYHGRSSKNLLLAQNVHEAAQEQKVEKDIQNSKIMTLCEYTQKLDSTVHTLHVYLEEYNAILHRILHTEGDDFEGYRLLSRKKIETAAILYKVISRIMDTDIVTADGALNPLSQHALAIAEERIEELSYGELSYQEEAPYVQPEVIEPIAQEPEDEPIAEETEEIEPLAQELELETNTEETENEIIEEPKEDSLEEILLEKKKED